LPSKKKFEHTINKTSKVLLYVVDGSIEVSGQTVLSGQCAIFTEGEQVRVATKGDARFLFISGEPLGEPIAWGGPIVMNTQAELIQAFKELDQGTFIKIVKRN